MIFAAVAGIGVGGEPLGISLTVTILTYFFIVMAFAFMRYTDDEYNRNLTRRRRK